MGVPSNQHQLLHLPHHEFFIFIFFWGGGGAIGTKARPVFNTDGGYAYGVEYELSIISFQFLKN